MSCQWFQISCIYTPSTGHLLNVLSQRYSYTAIQLYSYVHMYAQKSRMYSSMWLESMISVATLIQVPTFKPLDLCLFHADEVRRVDNDVRFMPRSLQGFLIFVFTLFYPLSLTIAVETAFRQ